MRPSVFSLDGLASWLETMPADQEYPFCDARKCGAAQYLKAHGEIPILSGKELIELGWWNIFSDQPNTFGAALARTRSAQGKAS